MSAKYYKILLKRNFTVGAVPSIDELEYGELCINVADGKLYTKLADDTIVELNDNSQSLDEAYTIGNIIDIDLGPIILSGDVLSKLRFRNSSADVDILVGTEDPYNGAGIDGGRGSLYIDSSTGLLYTKLDDGVSTNWRPMGGLLYKTHKIGSQADDAPTNTIYSLTQGTFMNDGWNVLVYVNGAMKSIDKNDYSIVDDHTIQFTSPLADTDDVEMLVFGGAGDFGHNQNTDTETSSDTFRVGTGSVENTTLQAIRFGDGTVDSDHGVFSDSSGKLGYKDVGESSILFSSLAKMDNVLDMHRQGIINSDFYRHNIGGYIGHLDQHPEHKPVVDCWYSSMTLDGGTGNISLAVPNAIEGSPYPLGRGIQISWDSMSGIGSNGGGGIVHYINNGLRTYANKYLTFSAYFSTRHNPRKFRLLLQAFTMDLGNAYDLDIDAQGRLYCVSMYNSRLKCYDNSGNFLWRTSGYDRFELLRGVAVNDNLDYIYLTEHDTVLGARILRFLKRGDNIPYRDLWKDNILSHGTNQDRIYDITVDANNNVWITSSDHYIYKLDQDMNYILSFGGYGTGNGQFGNDPKGIAVNDALSRVYVCDWGNHRIQYFDLNGNYQGQWGAFGSGAGQFNCPSHIAIDTSNNHVYVTDRNNSRVQHFDANGNYLSEIPIVSSTSPVPTGICLDSNKIYVNVRINSESYHIRIFDKSSEAEIGQIGPSGDPISIADEVFDINIGDSATRCEASGYFEHRPEYGENGYLYLKIMYAWEYDVSGQTNPFTNNLNSISIFKPQLNVGKKALPPVFYRPEVEKLLMNQFSYILRGGDHVSIPVSRMSDTGDYVDVYIKFPHHLGSLMVLGHLPFIVELYGTPNSEDVEGYFISMEGRDPANSPQITSHYVFIHEEWENHDEYYAQGVTIRFYLDWSSFGGFGAPESYMTYSLVLKRGAYILAYTSGPGTIS